MRVHEMSGTRDVAPGCRVIAEGFSRTCQKGGYSSGRNMRPMSEQRQGDLMKLRLCAFLVAVALFTPALAPHGFAAPGSEAAGPAQCARRRDLPCRYRAKRGGSPAKRWRHCPPSRRTRTVSSPHRGMRRRSPEHSIDYQRGRFRKFPGQTPAKCRGGRAKSSMRRQA